MSDAKTVAARPLIAVIEGFYFTAMGPITYHAQRSVSENAGGPMWALADMPCRPMARK